MIHLNDVLFIHIPKTGGTSVFDFLSKAATTNPLKIHPVVAKHALLQEIFDKKGAIGIDWGALRKIITIFRNPYDRFVSSYYFNRRIHEKNLYGAATTPAPSAAAKMPFKDWLKWALDNKQIRQDSDYQSFIMLNGSVPKNLEILFYEDKPECFRAIAKDFGYDPGDGLFQHSVRTPHPPYKKLYDTESEAMVYDLSRWAFDSGFYQREAF